MCVCVFFFPFCLGFKCFFFFFFGFQYVQYQYVSMVFYQAMSDHFSQFVTDSCFKSGISEDFLLEKWQDDGCPLGIMHVDMEQTDFWCSIRPQSPRESKKTQTPSCLILLNFAEPLLHKCSKQIRTNTCQKYPRGWCCNAATSRWSMNFDHRRINDKIGKPCVLLGKQVVFVFVYLVSPSFESIWVSEARNLLWVIMILCVLLYAPQRELSLEQGSFRLYPQTTNITKTNTKQSRYPKRKQSNKTTTPGPQKP